MDDYDNYYRLSCYITEYIQELIYDEEFDLIQINTIDPIDILKAVSIEFDDNNKSVPEKFLEYITVSERFLDTKIFVFVNFKEFFSDEEVVEIYNKLLLGKTKFLIIQSKLCKSIDFREIQYIIDEDYCEI